MRELLFLGLRRDSVSASARSSSAAGHLWGRFAIVHLALAALAFVCLRQAPAAKGCRLTRRCVNDGNSRPSLASGASDAVLGVVATAGFAWRSPWARPILVQGLLVSADLTLRAGRYELADTPPWPQRTAKPTRPSPRLRASPSTTTRGIRASRRSRLLLNRHCPLEVSGSQRVDQPRARPTTSEETSIASVLASSNTVVLVRTDAPPTQRYNWETRRSYPSEGTVFEALARLAE